MQSHEIKAHSKEGLDIENNEKRHYQAAVGQDWIACIDRSNPIAQLGLVNINPDKKAEKINFDLPADSRYSQIILLSGDRFAVVGANWLLLFKFNHSGKPECYKKREMPFEVANFNVIIFNERYLVTWSKLGYQILFIDCEDKKDKNFVIPKTFIVPQSPFRARRLHLKILPTNQVLVSQEKDRLLPVFSVQTALSGEINSLAWKWSNVVFDELERSNWQNEFFYKALCDGDAQSSQDGCYLWSHRNYEGLYRLTKENNNLVKYDLQHFEMPPACTPIRARILHDNKILLDFVWNGSGAYPGLKSECVNLFDPATKERIYLWDSTANNYIKNGYLHHRILLSPEGDVIMLFDPKNKDLHFKTKIFRIPNRFFEEYRQEIANALPQLPTPVAGIVSDYVGRFSIFRYHEAKKRSQELGCRVDDDASTPVQTRCSVM